MTFLSIQNFSGLVEHFFKSYALGSFQQIICYKFFEGKKITIIKKTKTKQNHKINQKTQNNPPSAPPPPKKKNKTDICK